MGIGSVNVAPARTSISRTNQQHIIEPTGNGHVGFATPFDATPRLAPPAQSQNALHPCSPRSRQPLRPPCRSNPKLTPQNLLPVAPIPSVAMRGACRTPRERKSHPHVLLARRKRQGQIAGPQRAAPDCHLSRLMMSSGCTGVPEVGDCRRTSADI